MVLIGIFISIGGPFFLIRNSLYHWKKKTAQGWSQDMEFDSFHAAKSCSLPQNGTRTITSLKKHNKWDKASGKGIKFTMSMTKE